MRYWLSSPKVRLGLLVNGLYLLSLALPSSSLSGGPSHARTYGPPAKRPPVYVSLPPSKTGASRAISHVDKEWGDLTVYLVEDLTLLGARGQQLFLSPTFTMRQGDESPDSVLLRFVSYSDEPSFTNGARLVISADGKQVWPAYDVDGEAAWMGWVEEKVPPYIQPAEGGGFMENVGKTIPYEVFADLIRANRVVVNIGPHLVQLNAEQLEALRDMHRAVAQPPAERFIRKRF